MTRGREFRGEPIAGREHTPGRLALTETEVHGSPFDLGDVILLDPQGPDAVVPTFPDDPDGFTDTLRAITVDGADIFVTVGDFHGPSAVTCRRTPAGHVRTGAWREGTTSDGPARAGR